MAGFSILGDVFFPAFKMFANTYIVMNIILDLHGSYKTPATVAPQSPFISMGLAQMDVQSPLVKSWTSGGVTPAKITLLVWGI